jgi:hypothetical protein
VEKRKRQERGLKDAFKKGVSETKAAGSNPRKGGLLFKRGVCRGQTSMVGVKRKLLKRFVCRV